jgi:hypothetical protein
MKKYIIIFTALMSSAILAQSYKIENVTGNVRALKGTSETYAKVNKGETLTASDLIETGEKSSVVIKMEEGKFPLKENSALDLNYLKSISKGDLILILASEEIKSAPDKNKFKKNENTAVYGANESSKGEAAVPKSDMGIKRLNGAKQLAENGFTESSILAAKDTYKKYPSTKNMVSYRIYFADKLKELGLYEEAYSEFSGVNELQLSAQEKEAVSARLDELKKKMMSN